MKKITLILFVFAATFNTTLSQVVETKNWCLSKCDLAGDELENTELVYLQIKNDSIINISNLDSIKRIPLRIAIIQEDSLEIEISELEVRRAIDNLNKSFVETNLVFYIERTDVILSKLKLEDLSKNLYEPYNKFSNKYDKPDLISIYVFEHDKEFCGINNNSISCGRTGGFSYILSEKTNNLVMSRFDLSDIKVFAHEMGHFWGLYHTFEDYQFGKDDFSNENCAILGDRICDTPPDPGTVFEVYVNYTTCELSNLKNEEGFEYKPLIENYMSYYKPCYLKEFSFTPGQIVVMKVAATLPIRAKFIR